MPADTALTWPGKWASRPKQIWEDLVKAHADYQQIATKGRSCTSLSQPNEANATQTVTWKQPGREYPGDPEVKRNLNSDETPGHT